MDWKCRWTGSKQRGAGEVGSVRVGLLTSPSSGDLITPTPGEPDPAGRVVVNSAWSLSAQGVSVLVGGAVSIYAVRSFTAVSWGHFSTALALVMLASVISGAGLGPLALREMTARPDQQGETLGLAFQA